MSAEETTLLDVARDSVSSFKVTRNAAGKVRIEIKIYSESNSVEDLDAAQAQLVRRYDELDAYYAPGGAK